MIDRIKDGRTDLVFDFVQSKTSPEILSELMQTCAYFGDVSAIRFLLTKQARLEMLGENFDLNGAAFHGHWQLCQFLIEQGAQVDFPLPDSQEVSLHAALCKANSYSHELVVRVLLANQANPNLITKPGKETGGFMRDVRCRGETPLHRAAAFGTETLIQMLLDAGAKIDAKDAHGDSPLTWASWHLRPDHILRKLCYGNFRIREGRLTMSQYLKGAPH
jgi:uncharacterized protein